MASTGDIRLNPPTLDGSRFSPEIRRRLNGQACARCGSTQGLRDGGRAVTPTEDGRNLSWPVRVCRRCPERV